MSKPIPSTTGVYKPGVGVTITRANIDLLQAARAKAKMDPITDPEVVAERLLSLNSTPDGGNLVEKRHIHRAALLM